MFWAKIRSLVKGLLHRRQMENEMADELRFHVESRADHLMKQYRLERSESLRRARVGGEI